MLGRSEDREYENENTLITQYVIYLFLPSHIFPLNKKTFFVEEKRKTRLRSMRKTLIVPGLSKYHSWSMGSIPSKRLQGTNNKPAKRQKKKKKKERK